MVLQSEMKLRQGNVFKPICGSVHIGGSLSGRTPPPLRDPLWTETPLVRDPTPPRQRPPHRTVMSGRYATYWNAFLCSSRILYNFLDMILYILVFKAHHHLKAHNVPFKSASSISGWAMISGVDIQSHFRK